MSLSNLAKLPNPPVGRIGWPWTNDFLPEPENPTLNFSWPRISIVTPSFNQGSFIEETIRSVLLQGYPNLEYIIMDGGSTDSTTSLLEAYRPHLAYLHVGSDGGQSVAIASGFEQASGEILAWLNSDDIYLPGALARVGRFFAKHPHHVFVGGNVELVDEKSQSYGMLRAVRAQLFLTKNTGGHGWWQPGTFWRRQAYDECGGMDTSLLFCMDRDLFIRLCSVGRSGRIIGRPLAAFREHQQQKSQTIKDIFQQEHELLLERYGSPRLARLRPFLGLLWRMWVKMDRLRNNDYSIHPENWHIV